MAGKGRTLRVTIAGEDKLSGVLGDLDGKLGGFGKKAGLAFAAAGAAGATAIAGLGAASVKTFADVDQQMREVYTLLPGISEQAMGKMREQVRDFSAEFGVLPQETIPALYQALSAGVPKDNVFEFLETAQKAAKGGVTELATAVDGISSVINAYAESGLSAAEASDQMFTAVRLGKTDFDQLSSSLFNVTPTTAALGVEFSDVTAALASLTAQGVPTSVATTQLRQLFVELSKESSKLSGTFEELSGRSFQDFIAEGGTTADAMALLGEHASDTDVNVSDLFSSVEAGAAALGLSGANLEGYRANLDAMGESAGATDAAFDTMNEGLGPLVDRLKALGAVTLDRVGESIAGVMMPALDRLEVWWEQNGDRVLGFLRGVGETVVVWWDEKARPAIAWLRDYFENVTLPTLEKVAAFVMDRLVPAVREFAEGALEGLRSIIEKVQGAIERNRPQLELLGLAVMDTAGFIVDHLGPVLGWLAREVLVAVGEKVALVIDGIGAFIEWMGEAKRAVQIGALEIAARFADMAADMLAAAAAAFSWIPGVGPKLEDAKRKVEVFRDGVNAALQGVRDREVRVNVQGYTLSEVIESENRRDAARARRGRAHGGPGPVEASGTSVSDSGIFRLSRDEHVVSAREVRAAGGHQAVAEWRRQVLEGRTLPGRARGGPADFRITAATRPGDPAAMAGGVERIRDGLAVRLAKVERARLKKMAEQGLGGTPADLQSVAAWMRAQVGKPYGWGAVGPGSYDCSGIWSAIVNVMRSRNPHSRLFATASFSRGRGAGGFVPGGGNVELGVRPTGYGGKRIGHMSGTFFGTNFESAGGAGVRMGRSARSARDGMFPFLYHLPGYAHGGQVQGDPPFDLLSRAGQAFAPHLAQVMKAANSGSAALYDEGGWLAPGVTRAVNLTGRREAVMPEDVMRATLREEAGVHLHFHGPVVGGRAGAEQLATLVDEELGRRRQRGQRVRVLA